MKENLKSIKMYFLYVRNETYVKKSNNYLDTNLFILVKIYASVQLNSLENKSLIGWGNEKIYQHSNFCIVSSYHGAK